MLRFETVPVPDEEKKVPQNCYEYVLYLILHYQYFLICFPLHNQHVQLLILLQVVVDVIMLEKDFSSKEEVCPFLKIANYYDNDKLIGSTNTTTNCHGARLIMTITIRKQ